MKTNYIKNVDPTNLVTPLRSLLKNVAASAYKIAPERQKDLEVIVNGLGLRITLDATQEDFAIYVDPAKRRITIGLAALERLWAYAYVYTHLFYLYQKLGGGFQIDLTTQADTEKSRRLLVWAHTSEIKKRHSAWPANLPRPDKVDPQDANITKANEMFLMIMGFIILHEVAHVKLKHRADRTMTSPDFIKQEYEADRWAAKWIMDEWREYKDDERVFIKRSLGVSFAIATLAGIELYFAKPSFKTHPNTAARLLAFLDEFVPEKAGAKAAPHELAWLTPPTILQVHLLKSGKKIDLKKEYATFRNYLVEAEKFFEK